LNPFPFELEDGDEKESVRWLKEGFGVDSGNAISSGRETTRAWRTFAGRTMDGKVTSS